MKGMSVLVAIAISIFWLAGLAMLAWSLWAAYRSVQAGSWPIAQGRLIRADLKEIENDGTTYQVDVEYSYQVDGQTFHGSRLAFGYVGSGGREHHAEIASKLLGAASLGVRYNPRDPAESCLSFGMHRWIKVALAFAAFWLAFTSMFALMVWLSYRRDASLMDNLSTQPVPSLDESASGDR